MTPVASKTFTSELVLERSSTSYQEPLGKHESTMDFYVQGAGRGLIEWDVPVLESTWHIGVWWDENKNLTDYDGLFSLPVEAIELLEEYGITVGADYR